MKSIKYLVFTGLLLNLISCSKLIVPTKSISAISYSDYEISYKIITNGKNRDEAMKNASTMVFENIFYVGAPNSINSQPMLSSNKTDTESFFLGFMKNKEYTLFVSSISESSYSNIDNISSSVKLETKITINIESLRRYLQTQGVIRKFGY